MTSKTIFNMNTKLKKVAMKKARSEGWTLSAVLNNAARAYIEDRFELEILPNNPVQINRMKKEIEARRFITWKKIKQELAKERSRTNSQKQHADKLLHPSKKTTTQPVVISQR